MTIHVGLLARIAIWAGALWGALQLATLHTSWDHAMCGVWGCGPTVPALVSCHLAWLIVLLPVALIGRRLLSTRWRRAIGVVTFVLVLAIALGVVAHEAMTWLAQAAPAHRAYFAQRCLFVIATWVDFPLVQLGLLSLVVWWPASDASRRDTATHADPTMASGASGE